MLYGMEGYQLPGLDRDLSKEDEAKQRPLTPAAQRALQEAEERRRARVQAAQQPRAKEVDGPKGPDPVRYGDWEKGGIASDF
jgi:hypothetical protein